MEDICANPDISAKFARFKKLHKLLNSVQQTEGDISRGDESLLRRRGRPPKTMQGPSARVGVEAQNPPACRTSLRTQHLTQEIAGSSGAASSGLPSGQLHANSLTSISEHKRTLKRWRVNFETVEGRGIHVLDQPSLPPPPPEHTEHPYVRAWLASC